MTAQVFAQRVVIRNLTDIERLEETPLEQALPVKSTYEIFCQSARLFGDKTALVFLPTADPAIEPIRWSYNDLLAGIHQTANLLHALDVRSSDSIAVLLPGCLEYHLALWGGEAAGIALPLNPLLSDEKLVSLMRVAGAAVLIAYGGEADANIWSKAMRIREQVPTLRHVLRVAPHDEPAEARPRLPDGVLDFHALRVEQPDDRLVSGRQIAAEDIAAYFHTGGTTGAPKLARHSHRAQVFTAWASAQIEGLSSTDVMINGFPLFHVAGVLSSSLMTLAVGGETVIPTTTLLRNREVIINYWHLVEKYRATVLPAVPTVLAALVHVPLGNADISSLNYCRTGAAPLSPELAARFEKQFNLPIYETLGMTEMAGLSTVAPPAAKQVTGSVGFRLPYAQIRIVAHDLGADTSARELPAVKQGMVQFKSPNLFSGFVDPQENACAFTADGWLISGDLGWLDDDGRLHINGRAKDLIIRSGHNIDPKVIEEALGAHPAVEVCAAVGAPDAYAGEIPVAFAVLRAGASVSREELLAFANERVDEAPAKPKTVIIIDKMPMTEVGKIYKPALRLLAAQSAVAAIVTDVCCSLDIDVAACPQVCISETQGIAVTLGADKFATKTNDLHERLRSELAHLPVKIELG